MPKSNVINLKISELNQLANDHDTIIQNLDQSIANISNVLAMLDSAYKGSATPFVDDFRKPFQDHIELLKGCYISSKAYIIQARDRFVEQDKKFAASIGSGGTYRR